MAALGHSRPARGASMQEHMAAAGAKDPAGAAAALAEEEIEAFEDLLAIDESDLLTTLKNCGIKAGSAAAIKKYCVQFGSGGGGGVSAGSARPPVPAKSAADSGGGAASGSGAAAEEAFAASNIKEALDGVDKLEEMLDAADGNADVAGHVLSCAGAVLKLASGVPGVGSIAKPFLECISFLQKVERETKDVIEILRQFLSMLRFIAELPETLEQLAARERQKLERELEKLLRLVEEFKAAIMSLGGGEKKKGTVLARMYRSVTKTAHAASTGITLVVKISKKVSIFFSSLKDMLGMLQNKAILQKLSQPPTLPMFEAAKSQIREFQAANPGASDEAAAAALEADPDKVQALAIAGGVSPEAFEGAMVEMKDVMGEHHAEAMANAKHYGEKLAAGQAAIRGEVQQVKCIL